MDLSALTGAVDLATVVAGILAIGAVMIGPQVAMYAVRKIKQAIK